MIDIESQVFNAVSTAIKASYGTAYVSNSYNPAPSKFPAVIVTEADNFVYKQTLVNSGEQHAQVMYEIDIYSDKKIGKKEQAKGILAVVDNTLGALGFVRTSATPMVVGNTDSGLYRLVARYSAVVSKNEIIYRRA